jgi:hypothetical protein
VVGLGRFPWLERLDPNSPVDRTTQIRWGTVSLRYTGGNSRHAGLIRRNDVTIRDNGRMNPFRRGEFPHVPGTFRIDRLGRQ